MTSSQGALNHALKTAAERRHLGPEEKHILFWDVNLAWTEAELDKAKKLWKEGVSLPGMADRLRRLPYEVELLALEMLQTNKWGKRKGGAYGQEQNKGD